MRHVYECPVRRADLHPGGTVNNVAYVDYLQEARLDLLRQHDAAVSAQPGEGLVVVGTVIEYLVPLTLASRPLFVASWVTEVRAASFTLAYELFTRPAEGDSPVVHARATTMLTPYDFGAGRPRRLSADERERLLRGPEPSPFPDQARPARPAPWADGAWRQDVWVRFSDIDLLGPRQQRPLPRLRAGGDHEPACSTASARRGSTATWSSSSPGPRSTTWDR